jgi:NAD-dependent deacetylase
MRPLQHAAALVAASNRIVVFTGAGVSTASGIPDFRSPASGLWENIDPMAVASMNGFRQNPVAFFNWIQPLVDTLINAAPNTSHHAITDLQRLGKLHGVITQNIDGLHQAAGTETVYELHGQLKTGTCTHCFQRYDTLPLLNEFRQTNQIPLCDCQPGGSVIKPDVILFGEQLPYQTVQKARRLLEETDLLIVAGSSLRVEPANHVPFTAVHHGAKLIVVNYEETPADPYAEVIFRDDVNTILPGIVSEL